MFRTVLILALAACAYAGATACAPVRIPTADEPIVKPVLIRVPQTPETQKEPFALEAPTLGTTVTEAPVTPTLLPTATPIRNLFIFDRNPRSILIDADLSGPVQVPRDAHVPVFRLYGDGLVVAAAHRDVPPAPGLDAGVRIGHLSTMEIQSLLAWLDDGGFFNLEPYYEPRPTPSNAPLARITVNLAKAKTVSVYGMGFPGTPQSFLEAMVRLTGTVPADAQPFTPKDGFLSAVIAGSATDFRAAGNIGDWKSEFGARLADSAEGTTVAGSNFSAIAATSNRFWPGNLYREGERVYRVRFAPNWPRSVRLTDWVGPILRAPREFDGRSFDVVGYFRGANLLGEAKGSPSTSSDWVLTDDSGSIFVSGISPPGLDPGSRADIWTVVRVRGVVAYVRNGTSHLDARKVEIVSP